MNEELLNQRLWITILTWRCKTSSLVLASCLCCKAAVWRSKFPSLSFVPWPLASGGSQSTHRWSCWKSKVPPSTREAGSWDSPRLQLYSHCKPGTAGQVSHFDWKLSSCICFTSQLHLFRARACMAWDLLMHGSLGVGWPGVPCFLLQGARWSWLGEGIHCGVKYLLQLCISTAGALFQASATMADKFSCSCTALGSGFQLYSYFLPSGNSDILSESGRIMSWLETALGKNFAATQLYFFMIYQKKGGKEAFFHHRPIHEANCFQGFFISYSFCYRLHFIYLFF